MSDGSFTAIRFRHSGLLGSEVVEASVRVVEFMPKVGELVHHFRERILNARESFEFAYHALALRYGSVDIAPVEPQTLLKARRSEDEGADLWHVMNRVGENLERGGVRDWHRDQHRRLRSVRPLRGIDSKVGLSKGLWGLAERQVSGESLDLPPWVEFAE